MVAVHCCRGIMNGLNVKEWDPAHDTFLPEGARFSSAEGLAAAKAHAKAILQRENGLLEDSQVCD